jgi:hypothetical protein
MTINMALQYAELLRRVNDHAVFMKAIQCALPQRSDPGRLALQNTAELQSSCQHRVPC